MATATADGETRVADVDPTAEVTSGWFGNWDLWGGYSSQANHIENVTRLGGWRLVEAQMTDEAISAPIRSIKQGILRQGMQITAMVDLDTDETDSGPKKDDLKQAILAEDHIQRAWNGLMTPGMDALERMLDAWAFRTVLAEQVWRDADSGDHPDDRGKYLLHKLKPLHPSSWRIELDSKNNIRGVAVPTERYLDGALLPIEKFCRLAVFPRHWSPLGQGALVEAYNPWNFKVQLMVLLWKYLQLFAVPTLKTEMPEGTKDQQELDAEGKPFGPVLPAAKFWARMTEKAMIQGARVLTFPPGAKADFLNPTGDGKVFENILALLDSQIARAIWQSAAQSATGSSSERAGRWDDRQMLGLVVGYGKRILGEMLTEQVFRPLMRKNFGDQIANRFTPMVTFGEIDEQDFSSRAGAIARLASVQLTPGNEPVILGPEDRPWIFKMLGLNWGRRRPRKVRPVVVRQAAA